ncbi:MAG: hypothetical protein KAW90_08175, partial [Dehalococcoidales bacterium]|nr:hypothetical protein [Dehalococcoidales bacterium]
GLRVQGTASSPSSTTSLKIVIGTRGFVKARGLKSPLIPPASAGAPARRTRLRQAGLRAGRLFQRGKLGGERLRDKP